MPEQKKFVFETEDGYDDNPLAKTATALGFLTIFGFGFYVIFYLKYYHKSIDDLESYLTARSSTNWVTIGFSMFASAVGSWVIAGPAYLSFWGGILAAFAYAFATAIPITLTAFWGANINKKFPHILSFSDFAFQRYGRVTQVLVIALSLLNMGIFATAEYTTIYGLYKNFVGLADLALFVILALAMVTLSYTAYGGLPVSIITDKVQGIAAFVLSTIIMFYLAASFNEENVNDIVEESNWTIFDPTFGLTEPFTMNDFVRGFNLTGYSALFTLPISLTAATIFSEAFWQRAWAAEDERALKKGACLGSCMVFFVVAVFAAPGVLISYSGILVEYEEQANLITLRAYVDEDRYGLIASGWGVVTVLLGTIMAQSAIDSLQNAIGASISGSIGSYVKQEKSLLIARVIVLILNIPLIIIGIQEYNILSLFLLGNMLTLCASFPILLGFYPEVGFLNRNIKDWTMPTSFLINFFTVGIYGQTVHGSFADGVNYAFWGNALYEYAYFLVCILASFISTLLLLCFNEAFGKLGYKSVLLGHIPEHSMPGMRGATYEEDIPTAEEVPNKTAVAEEDEIKIEGLSKSEGVSEEGVLTKT